MKNKIRRILTLALVPMALAVALTASTAPASAMPGKASHALARSGVTTTYRVCGPLHSLVDTRGRTWSFGWTCRAVFFTPKYSFRVAR